MSAEPAPLEVIEHAFTCPYCGEPITMLIDPASNAQEYIEDCEVCCNPISLHVRIRNARIVSFEARTLA